MQTLDILVVDDEQPIRDWIIYSIGRMGESMRVVGTAANGQQALGLIEAKHPDVVITDIRMPGMDGLELIRRGKAAQPFTRFIILSNYADFSYAREAVNLGAKQYLIKSELRGSDLEKLLVEMLQAKTEIRASKNKFLLSSGYADLYDVYTCQADDDFKKWTPNEYRYDYGHKNVYYPGDEGEMFRSGDVGGMTPYKLFESIKAFGGMCIPHHPAADWKLVSAATDWNFHDPSVQRLAEIFSRHAPFEDWESRSKYTKNIAKLPKCSVQDALARGYRPGFTAGSDSHQMEHGIEGGIVAAFLPELTRERLFSALYNRRCYGTTGARILVSFKADGLMMGSEMTLVKGAAVTLTASVLGTAPVTLELVKNNKTIWRQGFDGRQGEMTYVDHERTDKDCYYLRVTQKDEHMAWSSPIWVDEAR